MMYAFFKREYRDLWNKFVNRYNLSYFDCINYLYNIYIMSYRRRFINCYIKQMLHFNITITSRDENFHAISKRQLDKFTNDLKMIINEINFLLINELYIIKLIWMTTKYAISWSIKSRFLIKSHLASLLMFSEKFFLNINYWWNDRSLCLFALMSLLSSSNWFTIIEFRNVCFRKNQY